MDNTQGLGAAMEASYQRDQAKSQEQRIQALENQVRELHIQLFHLRNALNAVRGGY